MRASVRAATAPLDRALMAFVNDVIGELQEALALTDAEYFCECGTCLCTGRVRLTRAEYRKLHETSTPLLAASHTTARASV